MTFIKIILRKNPKIVDIGIQLMRVNEFQTIMLTTMKIKAKYFFKIR